MRTNKLTLMLAAVALSACTGVLDVPPTSSISSGTAINDASGARAALAGAYAGLQQTGMFGHEIVDWTEVLSDNLQHSGTFDDYADADNHLLRSDNIAVETVWDDTYDDINRVNEIIDKVPNVADLEAGEKDEILGEAYFLRALDYHSLVRLWGGGTEGVPLRLTPVASAAEANQIERATLADTYAQILADLSQAEQLITALPSVCIPRINLNSASMPVRLASDGYTGGINRWSPATRGPLPSKSTPRR